MNVYASIEAHSADIPQQLTDLLQAQKNAIDALLSQPITTYNALVPPLEALNNTLHQFWSKIAHLNAVKNSDALRAAFDLCLPLLSTHSTWLGHHKKLYQAFQAIAHHKNFTTLTPAQQHYVEHELRDFKLAGVALPEAQKKQFSEITERLSILSHRFEENLLDSSDAWGLGITDPNALKGLPDYAMALFAQQARAKNLPGYWINLQFPSYHAVITYADDRALRKTLYEAWVTRASAQHSEAPSWDNTPVLYEILSLRQKLAALLDFKHYADYSLCTKMAKDTEQVEAFLIDLLQKAKPFAEQEWETLKTYAATIGLDKPEPWDIAYLSEQLKQKTFTVDDAMLRPYFPLSKVLEGLFTVANRLFQITFEKTTEKAVWHPDVQVYRIKNPAGETIAYFYCDLYARDKKRGGAWMDDSASYWRKPDGTQQLPEAFLTCNFTPPVGTSQALLTHDEVVTLFHEFGHGLHHMLTEVPVLGLSGINGVEWDAVELPSQLMENWCWQAACLPLMSAHYETQAPLPETILKNLIASKNFQAGLFLLRQIEVALFGLRLHRDFDPHQGPEQVQTLLDQVRREVAVLPTTPINRFQNSFSHIFAGGYASGYYSYLWAEVLAADAFSFLKEQGGLHEKAGEHLRATLLSQGGSSDAAVLFRNFRGRDPSLDPLLESYGLSPLPGASHVG